MKLSAPRNITFVIAVIAGVLGLLGSQGIFSLGAVSELFLLGFGFVLLALGSLLKGL